MSTLLLFRVSRQGVAGQAVAVAVAVAVAMAVRGCWSLTVAVSPRGGNQRRCSKYLFDQVARKW